jgi:hypothetical protein
MPRTFFDFRGVFMRLPITFLANDGTPTKDYVHGWPIVYVNIEVGFEPPSDPNKTLIPNFIRVPAIVDTGANNTLISDDLAAGLTPLYTIPSVNTGIIRTGRVFNALLEIIGLDEPLFMKIGCSSLQGSVAPVLLGRNLLQKYRMVYDTPGEEFYLEKLLMSAQN